MSREAPQENCLFTSQLHPININININILSIQKLHHTVKKLKVIHLRQECVSTIVLAEVRGQGNHFSPDSPKKYAQEVLL